MPFQNRKYERPKESSKIHSQNNTPFRLGSGRLLLIVMLPQEMNPIKMQMTRTSVYVYERVLFVSKGFHGIDLGCASGWDIRGQGCDGDHKPSSPDHRERIVRFDAVENTSDHTDQSQCDG